VLRTFTDAIVLFQIVDILMAAKEMPVDVRESAPPPGKFAKVSILFCIYAAYGKIALK